MILPLPNERMKCVVVNVVRMLPARELRVPLWSIVSHMTGHGSGYSVEICKELDLDPNQIVKKKYQALMPYERSSAG